MPSWNQPVKSSTVFNYHDYAHLMTKQCRKIFLIISKTASMNSLCIIVKHDLVKGLSLFGSPNIEKKKKKNKQTKKHPPKNNNQQCLKPIIIQPLIMLTGYTQQNTMLTDIFRYDFSSLYMFWFHEKHPCSEKVFCSFICFWWITLRFYKPYL